MLPIDIQKELKMKTGSLRQVVEAMNKLSVTVPIGEDLLLLVKPWTEALGMKFIRPSRLVSLLL